MELFTLGKSELAGPGDYYHVYRTRCDGFCKSINRLDSTCRSSKLTYIALPVFNPNLHDASTKTLSSIWKQGNRECRADRYKNVVDVIF